jgi:radical SAM superfamily enzyme YgiQ (UPF0313 family)
MATIFLTVTTRKPTEHIKECLESVYTQTHKDWIAHIAVDDCETADKDILLWLQKQATRPNVVLELVPERRYALKNQLDAIDKHCPHYAVVGKLDGDDTLSDPDALKAVSQEYDNDPILDIMWTKFRSNSKTPCCCGVLPEGADPFTHGWKSSHFQTFRKALLWGVRREVFQDPESGMEWQCSCDHALYLPLLKIARRRKFLNRVCYFYRRGEGDNRSADQKTAASRIRQHNIDLNTYTGPKKVLFIVNGPSAQRDKRFYNGERRPPLGILSMASHLRSRGHEVKLVDRFMNPDWTPKAATVQWADFIGFYISTPNALDAKNMITYVRQCGYKGTIAAGGPHTILWPEQVKSWGVDLLCHGEADFAISQIVETGRMPEMERRLEDLDTIPFPAYDMLAEQRILKKYSQGWPFTKSHKAVMTLNTSRGCPFSCDFCDVKTVWGRKYNAMSPERVALDVEALRSRWGATAVYFREDNFCCDPARVERICELMPEGVAWACEMRADVGSNPEFVRKMAQAGCIGYYIGAESGSDRLLEVMKKGITASQIVDTCNNASKYGVFVALSMIMKYPGETPEDRAHTASMLKKVKARHVWKAPYRKPWGAYEGSPVQ